MPAENGDGERQMANREITTRHLNIALDLAAKRGFGAKDIQALTLGHDGGVVIELPPENGFARFVSNRSFGL